MQELRGMVGVSGEEVWVLVVLNLLLDCLIGCTSGGLLVEQQDQGKGEGKRMLHFRTLDWEMDGLRNLLVVLEFFRSKSEEPEKVVARSITYAGFVGVLTGVREGLSISLNNRRIHHCSSLRLHIHQFFVTIGYRPSIASILRSALLSSPDDLSTSNLPLTLPQLTAHLSTVRSAPCYLILSDGSTTTYLTKDLITATSKSSSEIFIQTNHDVGSPRSEMKHLGAFMKDSRARRKATRKKWSALKNELNEKLTPQENEKGGDTDGATDVVGADIIAVGKGKMAINEKTLGTWLRDYPTMNGNTHFICILDPTAGTVCMLERGLWVADEFDGEGEDEGSTIDVDDVLVEEAMILLSRENGDVDGNEKVKSELELDEKEEPVVDEGVDFRVDRGRDAD